VSKHQDHIDDHAQFCNHQLNQTIFFNNQHPAVY
jgi:hypothetical protein